MFRTRVLLGFLAFALVLTGGLSGQDKKFKPRLPAGWVKLGLIDKQKDAIYAVQEKYHEKFVDLEKKIADLKKSELDEMVKVLDDKQKTRLKELDAEKKGTEKKTDE